MIAETEIAVQWQDEAIGDGARDQSGMQTCATGHALTSSHLFQF